MKVEKPWGWYIDLFRSETLVKKILFVRRGEQISFQFHKNRKEVWRFLEGCGTMRLADSVESPSCYFQAVPGELLEIRQGQLHQVIADKEDMLIFEIQSGTTCEENDIVRVGNDKYGRDLPHDQYPLVAQSKKK